jgi:hypothetical protein
MNVENLKCFGCGGKGHLERDCPSSVVVGGTDKPMWCGTCDRRTRLIESHGLAARCPQCHPLNHVNLPQHIRCPGCRMLVYVWDVNPCGQHSSPAKPFDTRPEREQIDAIIAAEMVTGERSTVIAEHRDDPDEAA